MEIQFNDLATLFKTNVHAGKSSDYMRTEYIELKREPTDSHVIKMRLIQLEQDPSTKVFAMKFNGINDSKETEYQVIGDHEMFALKKGDYLLINQNEAEDMTKLQVMDRETFRNTYSESYNF